MKILQINKFHWLKGGSEAAYFGLMELLEKHGHQVANFSMKDKCNLPSKYENFFAENVSYDTGGVIDKSVAAMKIIYNLDARVKIGRLLEVFTPDVAHFHIFQHQISPSVFGPLKKRGIPIVLTLHDLKPICPNYKMFTHDGICERCMGKKFYNCTLHRCSKGALLKSLVNTIEMYLHYMLGYYQGVDRFIAASMFHYRKMLEFGFPDEQLTYVPNFIDATAFSSGADSSYGLYFGRLAEDKGLQTLLAALGERSEIRFFIVGSGPAEDLLRRSAERAELKNVSFLGFKQGEELRRLVEGASFAVIPSDIYENCPMSVLESFAAGKPVIGSNRGGIPELIADGEDGLIFNTGDADDLAEKMGLLWDKPQLRVSMGARGKEKVGRDFTPELHYERTMAVYRKVTNR